MDGMLDRVRDIRTKYDREQKIEHGDLMWLLDTVRVALTLAETDDLADRE